MALDDYLESEVAIAVAATTAMLSPRVRGVLRRGAVLGLAGALTAADMLGSFTRGVAQGMGQTAVTATNAIQDITDPAEKGDNTPKAPPEEGRRRPRRAAGEGDER